MHQAAVQFFTALHVMAEYVWLEGRGLRWLEGTVSRGTSTRSYNREGSASCARLEESSIVTRAIVGPRIFFCLVATCRSELLGFCLSSSLLRMRAGILLLAVRWYSPRSTFKDSLRGRSDSCVKAP